MEHPNLTVDVTGIEFLRNYDPSVVSWKLTDIGKSRLEAGLFPPGLPARARGLIRLLKRLEIAEEDELADYMGYTLRALRALLKRLGGYGYAEQVV